jgi:hypothetical protein
MVTNCRYVVKVVRLLVWMDPYFEIFFGFEIRACEEANRSMEKLSPPQKIP